MSDLSLVISGRSCRGTGAEEMPIADYFQLRRPRAEEPDHADRGSMSQRIGQRKALRRRFEGC